MSRLIIYFRANLFIYLISNVLCPSPSAGIAARQCRRTFSTHFLHACSTYRYNPAIVVYIVDTWRPELCTRYHVIARFTCTYMHLCFLYYAGSRGCQPEEKASWCVNPWWSQNPHARSLKSIYMPRHAKPAYLTPCTKKWENSVRKHGMENATMQ